MKRNSGNALLVVTLMSVVMVLTAMVMIGMTSTQQKSSYGLNNQVALRYASEAGIEEVKLRLFKDKNDDPAGTWFLPLFKSKLSPTDLIAYNGGSWGPFTAVAPGLTRTLATTNVRSVTYDVYFDTTGIDQEYEARVIAYVTGEGQAKFSTNMKMKFSYRADPAAPDGESVFSKYSLFVDRWDPNLWFGHEIYDGYIHSNTRFQFMFTDFRCFKETTHVTNNQFYGSWTNAQKNALFPGGRTQLSGPIPMPSFNDIKDDIRPIAQAGPAKLYVDPGAPNPNPWRNVDMDVVKVTFVWDQAALQNIAIIESYKTGVRTHWEKYNIPKDGSDTLIYTDRRVELKGIIQGRVTVATEHSGSNMTSPSMTVTDDVIYVDDLGRPKMWVFQNPNSTMTPMPASGRTITTDPQNGTTYKYEFAGIPTASNPTSNNINTKTYGGNIVWWNDVSYGFKQNPAFAPTPVVATDPVLGLITDGKYKIAASCPYNTIQSWAMYTQNNTYQVEQNSEKGNMAKFGSLVVKDTPWDATLWGWGDGQWYGYNRCLPHKYDQHMLNNPPPFYVQIPSVSQNSNVTVTVVLGATMYSGRAQ